MLNDLLYFLRTLLNPVCWLRNDPVNYEWDSMLVEQLKAPLFTDLKDHTVKLNGVEVWISNYPYAACSDWSDKNKGLPKRTTVIKFMDALRRATI